MQDFNIFEHWSKMLPGILLALVGSVAHAIICDKEITFRSTVKIMIPAGFAGTVVYFFLHSVESLTESSKIALVSLTGFGSGEYLFKMKSILTKFLDRFLNAYLGTIPTNDDSNKKETNLNTKDKTN